MSKGKKIPLAQATQYANEVVEYLTPYCERIEIAGSIRRQKERVGDIEIVCISKTTQQTDLFGADTGTNILVIDGARQLIREQGERHVKGAEKYRQFTYKESKVDLFITSAESWGVIFMIRTGSFRFSRKMVSNSARGGFLPMHMRVQDSRLYAHGIALETPEESDYFKYIGKEFVAPRFREINQ